MENTVVKQESTDIEKISASFLNIENKRNKIMFFVPDLGAVPSGAVYEIYFHATLLKSLGYTVKIFTETNKYLKPEFIESELTDLEHVSMENARMSVAPEDVLVIPEIFTNVMEQTKNVPCVRVVLFQSVDNMLRSLSPGLDWTSFGINHVITTSNMTKMFLEDFYGKKFNVHTYNVAVPNYFKKVTKIKRPVISLLVRNETELDRIIKLFYAKYPHYRWVTFEPMQTDSKPPKYLRRKDFAEKLDKNFAALWIDRLATHAQFPLECMKVGTIPIALKPDITPEYIIENGKLKPNSGLWTTDIYELPDLIAEALRLHLEDEIPTELTDTMDAISSNYNPEIATLQLTAIYTSIFDERKNLLKSSLDVVSKQAAPQPADESIDAVRPLTDQLLSN